MISDAVSVFGDQIGWIALLWFIMVTTNHSADIGLAALCFGLPGVFLGPIVGNILDRFPQKQIIIAVNLFLGGIFFGIPLLYWFHHLSLPCLMILAIIAGCLTPFVTVGWMVLLPNVVSARYLSAANAINEMILQSALMAGPLAGGMLIASLGAPVAVWLDGLSFLIAVLCILPVKVSQYKQKNVQEHSSLQQKSFWKAIWHGFKYLYAVKAVWWVTIGALCLNFAYGILDVSLPLYIHQELKLSAVFLGNLWMTYFIGSICGAVLAGFIEIPLQKGVLMSFMIIGWGVCFLQMIWLHYLLSSFIIMGLAGFLFGGYSPMARTAVQTLVPKPYQGRVFGLRISLIAIGVPSGSYVSGLFSQWVRPSLLIGMTGIPILILGMLLLFIRGFRTI